MYTGHFTWDAAAKVWLPIAAVLVVLLAVGVVLTLLWATNQRRSRYGDPLGGYLLGAIFAGVAVAIIAGTVGGMYPWKGEYHQYRQYAGTIQQLQVARDLSDTVVHFNGNPDGFDINDTRGALLKPGDSVTLWCKRNWDYGSNDAGYDCKWGQ